jgi:hypothetical protein
MGVTVAPAARAYTPGTKEPEEIRKQIAEIPEEIKQNPWESFDTMTNEQRRLIFYNDKYEDDKWKNDVNSIFEGVGNTVLHPIDTVTKDIVQPLSGLAVPLAVGAVAFLLITNNNSSH